VKDGTGTVPSKVQVHERGRERCPTLPAILQSSACQSSRTMHLRALLFVACSVCSALAIPSVDFAENGESAIDFGKGVDVLARSEHENDVDSEGEQVFLRNFKSLTNSTDLEALPSEDVGEQKSADEKVADSRSDTDATRVLRGVHHQPDLNTLFSVGLSLLVVPFTQTLRRNKHPN